MSAARKTNFQVKNSERINADFLNPKRKKGSGRIPKIMKEKAVRQLKVMFDQKDGVTQA